MDTVRYFKDHAKAQLKAARGGNLETAVRLSATRGAAEPATLQRVQHQVAVEAGYRSWQALLKASEADRQLAAVMTREPKLSRNGMGYGSFHTSPAERRQTFDEGRAELRTMAKDVAEVTAWLLTHIEPIRTINRQAGSYSHKHTAERAIGRYVANGELIAAAIIAGYPYKREAGDSPNVYFGMSARSLRALRSTI